MKTKTLKFAATIIIPAALLALTGCKTPPVNPLATESSPTLAGGLPVVGTFCEKAVVTSIIPGERTLALRSDAGKTLTCKAAPQVANFSQLQAGDRVKATVTDATALFLAKNGPPPSAGAGVVVPGSAEAPQSAKVVLQTTDFPGKITKVDPSYRLMTVEYANGGTKEFKVPLPATLESVKPGDEVVVRATELLAICVQPR
jgi:hypothetical protein